MTRIARIWAAAWWAAAGALAGCGTILYPRRIGQRPTDRVDVAVVALDAVGLIFFLVPGVIAFAVDYNNRTLYLPKSERGVIDVDRLDKIRLDPRGDARREIESALERERGVRVRLDDPSLLVARLGAKDELRRRLLAFRRDAAAR